MCPQDEPDKLNRADAPTDGSLQRFEAQLASLSPRAVQLDRDRLMFLAGQASSSSGMVNSARQGWAWPAAFSAMTALAASLLALIVVGPQPGVVERIVYLPAEVVVPSDGSRLNNDRDELPPPVIAERLVEITDFPSPADKAAPGRSYVDLRDRVLAMGLDTWQNEPADSGGRRGESPAAYHDLLDSLLHGG
jgi:hypothetical protein